MATPLNPRQMKFVQGYLAGKPAKQAYIAAGYKSRGHAAESGADQLLRNTGVRRLIDAARQKAAADLDITPRWVVRALVRLYRFRGEGASHAARVRAVELLG